MTHRVRLVLSGLLLLVPVLSAAQVVAPPDPKAPATGAPAPPPPPPPLREGSADFAFVGTTGNSSTQTIGLGVEYLYRPEQWVWHGKVGYIRNHSDEELKAEAFSALFRADRALTARLSAFGEYSYLHDRFAGIEHRNAVVGGLSYKLVNQARQILLVDGGFGYLNEQRVTGEDVSTGTYNAGLSYRAKISETATFGEDFRYTGAFSNADDWRIDQVAALTAKLTTVLSLKVSNTIRYANFPPPGFEKTDTITAVALVAKF